MIATSSSLHELRGLAARDPKTAATNAAREFESMILAEMMKAGTKPLFGEHPLDGGSAGRMAREQHFAQLAALASRGEGFGLVREIEQATAREEA